MNKILFAAVLVLCGLVARAAAMPSPCSGKIERVVLAAPQLADNYTVDIWLPENYDASRTEPYPVIYMQDGQNLFDANMTWNHQEWGVDEACTALNDAGICREAIVVGIHNNATRFSDYSPEKAISGNAALVNKILNAFSLTEMRGDRYVDFLVATVKPYVEQKYNASSDKSQVSLMGSSMGGIISLYIMCEHPDLFGAAACLSTHWLGTLDTSTPEYADAVIAYLQEKLPSAADHRLYLDHGTAGLDANYAQANNRAIAVAESKGYERNKNLVTYIAQGADHTEKDWSTRIDRPLRVLVPGETMQYNGSSYGLTPNIFDGVILHCFSWKLSDIIDELPNIARAGFTAVQTSPMQRAVSAGDVWYDVYRPYDYRFIDNAMGTRADMETLCRKAEEYGIKVIVDIVANHGTGTDEPHDPWWDVNGRMRWHTGGIDYSDRYSETHNELGGYGDSNSDDPEVQQRTLDYVRELKSLGVKGLRWDAAKHIQLPSEGCDFWNTVLSEPGISSYGEILGTPAGDSGVDLLQEYTSMMHVTDSGFSGNYAHESHYWLNIDPTRLIYWPESHDTYCNAGVTAGLTEDEIDRRWALVASRRGASALYLSRPFEKTNNKIKVAVKGSTHFSSDVVAAVNHFHNAMADLEETFADSDEAKAVYRRHGVVIVKEGGGPVSIPAGNLEKDRIYKDEITGSTFTLSGNTLSGEIDAASGIAVVYDYEHPEPVAPVITASSAGGNIYDQDFCLTLASRYALKSCYSINGGSPEYFEGEVKIPLGRMMNLGESCTVSWTAFGQSNNATGSARFIYSESDDDVKVYLHFDDPDWGGTFYTFIYYDGTTNAAWPGKAMTRDDSLSLNGFTGGWYYYDVPQNLKYDGLAMVSNNGPNRYPANMEPGIPLNGRSLAFIHHNGKWITTQDITGLDNVSVDIQAEPTAWYTLSGMRISTPQPGQLYIVRYTDGSVIKQIAR